MSDKVDLNKKKKQALLDAGILTIDESGNVSKVEKKGDLNDFKGDYDGDWSRDMDSEDKDLSGDGTDGVKDN
jgi:hypothetical protein